MKIYCFNPETGAYLGEDFADEPVKRGALEMPPDTTTIAPPQVEPGQTLFFNVQEQRWEVHNRPDP